jgi:formate dehydrogenase iron-sulfur subunit
VTGKMIVIDTSKCTACRACQVACKQWNGLSAEVTENRGGYENPLDLSHRTYTRILFNEVEKDGSLKRYFGQHRCMHCEDAGCLKACPVPGAIIRDGSGAVVIDQALCTGCKYCVFSCPFNVPRYDAENARGFGSDRAFKCTMCFDRQQAGEQPACTKTCPTGALLFADRAKLGQIIKSAEDRGLTVYKGAHLNTGVIYLLQDSNAELYRLPAKPAIPTPTYLWRTVMKPLGMAAFILGIVGVIAHYVYVGPKDADNGRSGPRTPSGEEGVEN